MKIESQAYKGQSIRIFDEVITFGLDGIVEVNDELGKRIVNSGLRIYREGEVPSKKSKAEMELEKELERRVQAYKVENDSLRIQINGLNAKIQRLNDELKLWKDACESLKKDPTSELPKTESIEEKEVVKSEDDEIREQLEGKKKDELVEMAKQLGITEDQLMVDGRYKKKDEIIDLLLSVK
jgi:chromosome segregation ATPase